MKTSIINDSEGPGLSVAIHNTSIIDDNGEVYLSELEPKGKLQVQWGNTEKCYSDYNLGTENIKTGITTITLICR
ncbi:FimD/PapC C-terminal domain-containing protein [Vagococcus sp. WN89Y]|uniref:FimD/PapC C-terminal domain-containing protein n=1 Tax=Vagococcus sp. WN89Y TaxID=3457258 RepID=UPI003FCE1FBA